MCVYAIGETKLRRAAAAARQISSSFDVRYVS